jgi:hypothetical protein
MLAWGIECSTWDDSVDYAHIMTCIDEPRENLSDDDHVMTTWHEDETLDEVFTFAKSWTRIERIDLQLTLLIHITEESNEPEMLARFERAAAD